MPPLHHRSSSSHLPSGHDPNRVRLASLYFYLFIFDLIGLLRTRLCYGLIVYFHLNSFERELLCPIALPPCHQGIVFPIKVFKKLHPSSQLPINQNERERESLTFLVQRHLSTAALPTPHFQVYMAWIW